GSRDVDVTDRVSCTLPPGEARQTRHGCRARESRHEWRDRAENDPRLEGAATAARIAMKKAAYRGLAASLATAACAAAALGQLDGPVPRLLGDSSAAIAPSLRSAASTPAP